MFYRRFIPKATDCPSSLNAYMEDIVKTDTLQVIWTSESVATFSKFKEAITSPTLLPCPVEDVEKHQFI